MDDIKINFVDTNKEERIIPDSFYNWFENQVIVSYFPKVQMLETFDVIINVSDEFSQSVSKYCIDKHIQNIFKSNNADRETITSLMQQEEVLRNKANEMFNTHQLNNYHIPVTDDDLLNIMLHGNNLKQYIFKK